MPSEVLVVEKPDLRGDMLQPTDEAPERAAMANVDDARSLRRTRVIRLRWLAGSAISTSRWRNADTSS